MEELRNLECNNSDKITANLFANLNIGMARIIDLEAGPYSDEYHKSLEDSLMSTIHRYCGQFPEMDGDTTEGFNKRLEFAQIVDRLIKAGSTLGDVLGIDFSHSPKEITEIFSGDSQSNSTLSEEDIQRFMSSRRDERLFRVNTEQKKPLFPESPKVGPLVFDLETVDDTRTPKRSFRERVAQILPFSKRQDSHRMSNRRGRIAGVIGGIVAVATLSTGLMFMSGFDNDSEKANLNNNRIALDTRVTYTTEAPVDVNLTTDSLRMAERTDSELNLSTKEDGAELGAPNFGEESKTEIGTATTEENTNIESPNIDSQILQPETVVVIQQGGNLWNSLEQLAGLNGLEADNNRALQTAIANSLPAVAEANKMTVEQLSLLFANQGITVPPEVLANLVGAAG